MTHAFFTNFRYELQETERKREREWATRSQVALSAVALKSMLTFSALLLLDKHQGVFDIFNTLQFRIRKLYTEK